ncbi:MAG: hypothetical protein ACPH3I_01895 [Porticoccaceae bacterium]
MKPPEKTAPDCWRCIHFNITHDPKRPYGCRAMGFKSKMLPSMEVIRVHGDPCLSFSPKPVDPTGRA